MPDSGLGFEVQALEILYVKRPKKKYREDPAQTTVKIRAWGKLSGVFPLRSEARGGAGH